MSGFDTLLIFVVFLLVVGTGSPVPLMILMTRFFSVVRNFNKFSPKVMRDVPTDGIKPLATD